MTAVETEVPVVLADALQGIAHLLGGAAFVGRHPTSALDGADGSRWYIDPDDSSLRYQSVTWTIGSTTSAPWLPAWAAGLVADVVVDEWSTLGAMARAEGLTAVRRYLTAQATLQRELAADVGTHLHDILEARLLDMPEPCPPEHVLGRRLKTGGDVIDITEETLTEWAEGITHFLTDYRIRPVMAEATVCHPIEGYAARIDLGAEFPGLGLGLVDLKSGAVRKSAIAQLTAQKNATEMWLPLGERVEMPRFDWGAVLHLRPKWARGYKLQRVPTGPGEWAWFRAMNDLLKRREDDRDDLEVIYPPIFDAAGEPAALIECPMVEDLPVRCARILAAEGFVWLHELAAVRVTDLLSVPASKTSPRRGIRGIGPKAVNELRGLLAVHDMSFADEREKRAA